MTDFSAHQEVLHSGTFPSESCFAASRIDLSRERNGLKMRRPAPSPIRAWRDLKTFFAEGQDAMPGFEVFAHHVVDYGDFLLGDRSPGVSAVRSRRDRRLRQGCNGC